MLPILAMLLASSAVPDSMVAVPVSHGTIQSADMAIPVSDSVRAATWDSMAVKPDKPVHFRVACIVIGSFGLPGACVPASSVDENGKTINWAKARDDYDQWERTADPKDVALLRVVTERLNAARAPKSRIAKSLFAIQFFDEVVSPEDARAPYALGDALAFSDIKLTKPIDGALLSWLYPTAALRNGVSAQVLLVCDIQPNLKLLCRDQGRINLAGTGAIPDSDRAIHDFRFATYQFASTLQLEPMSLKGDSVAGRQLKLYMSWKLPE